MDDSKRLMVLKALTAQLLTIQIANGYQFDMAEKSVFRGRPKLSEEVVLPALSVLESPRQVPTEPPNRRAGVTKEVWELYITGWVKDDIVNPTDDAHRLLADTKKALSKVFDERDDAVYMFGGLIYGLQFDGGICRPPDEHSDKAYFLLSLQVDFVEDTGDPYDLGIE